LIIVNDFDIVKLLSPLHLPPVPRADVLVDRSAPIVREVRKASRIQ
jgi:hypothetical protein